MVLGEDNVQHLCGFPCYYGIE
ncbi:unnamed protein product, partial [Adineta steineri]